MVRRWKTVNFLQLSERCRGTLGSSSTSCYGERVSAPVPYCVVGSDSDLGSWLISSSTWCRTYRLPRYRVGLLSHNNQQARLLLLNPTAMTNSVILCRLPFTRLLTVSWEASGTLCLGRRLHCNIISFNQF